MHAESTSRVRVDESGKKNKSIETNLETTQMKTVIITATHIFKKGEERLRMLNRFMGGIKKKTEFKHLKMKTTVSEKIYRVELTQQIRHSKNKRI